MKIITTLFLTLYLLTCFADEHTDNIISKDHFNDIIFKTTSTKKDDLFIAKQEVEKSRFWITLDNLEKGYFHYKTADQLIPGLTFLDNKARGWFKQKLSRFIERDNVIEQKKDLDEKAVIKPTVDNKKQLQEVDTSIDMEKSNNNYSSLTILSIVTAILIIMIVFLFFILNKFYFKDQTN